MKDPLEDVLIIPVTQSMETAIKSANLVLSNPRCGYDDYIIHVPETKEEFDELLRYDDLALIKYTAGSRKGRYAVKSDILEEEYHTPLIYEEFDTNEEASEYFDLLIGGSNEIQ